MKPDVDGKVTMYLTTGTGRLTEATDVTIELTTTQEESYHIVNVTAPAAADGTLAVDQKLPAVGATVTATATAVAGRKVTGVTVVPVNAESTTTVEVTPGENGTYTFTMPSEDVTVAATYDRADIASLEVTGATTASTGSTETYTVVAKAADGTVLTPNEGEIVWTVEGVTENTTIANGVLTVAADEPVTTAVSATVSSSLSAYTSTVVVPVADDDVVTYSLA